MVVDDTSNVVVVVVIVDVAISSDKAVSGVVQLLQEREVTAAESFDEREEWEQEEK